MQLRLFVDNLRAAFLATLSFSRLFRIVTVNFRSLRYSMKILKLTLI